MPFAMFYSLLLLLHVHVLNLLVPIINVMEGETGCRASKSHLKPLSEQGLSATRAFFSCAAGGTNQAEHCIRRGLRPQGV